jgi:ELWxxDGT repeat protein
VSGGRFYFAVDDGVHGNEVWVTDGTPAGTHLAADVNPGPAGSDPAALADVGGVLYFAATNPVAGREVWKIAGPDAPPAINVVGSYVFYNNSSFDGQDPLPGPSDDNAIAPDKRALLPGQAASAANVSGYSHGINGVMLDITHGLPLTALAGGAGGVEVKFGNGGDPSAWPDAPRPSQIAIRPGAGVNGSDRVTLVWPDGAIKNGWLRVKVRAMPQYGLMQDEVFTFGNLPGETGDAGSPFRVTALDLGGVKRVLNNTAEVASPFDINRDGRINALDLALVKSNLNHSLTPPTAPAPAASAPPPTSEEGSLSPTRVWEEPAVPLL